jgi:hypothetical protein
VKPPCVKSRSQNWDPTSWKSRPKSFQVSILETASVKIHAPKLRSQVLKTMSWKLSEKWLLITSLSGCSLELCHRQSGSDPARHPVPR